MKISLRTAFILALLATTTSANAIPGYHINNENSAQKAVRQFADDSFKFRAAIYQAYLDKSLWRLTLAAHRHLQQKPDNLERQCSFATAYWQSQVPEGGVRETVPVEATKQLQGLYNEAVQYTKKTAEKMPNSVAAQINYGYYLMYFVPGMEKVKPMVNAFKKAVVLRPDLGTAHYWLAMGYFGSGDYTPENADNVIVELNHALVLDPKLTSSYFFLAAAYWQKKDYRKDKFYLDKFLSVHPEQASRPDIVRTRQILREKISGR